jgi:hypothetical protein
MRFPMDATVAEFRKLNALNVTIANMVLSNRKEPSNPRSEGPFADDCSQVIAVIFSLNRP